jgi:hypothetical protein
MESLESRRVLASIAATVAVDTGDILIASGLVAPAN